MRPQRAVVVLLPLALPVGHTTGRGHERSRSCCCCSSACDGTALAPSSSVVVAAAVPAGCAVCKWPRPQQRAKLRLEGVSHLLILSRVERTRGVDEPASRPHEREGTPQEQSLELRQCLQRYSARLLLGSGRSRRHAADACDLACLLPFSRPLISRQLHQRRAGPARRVGPAAAPPQPRVST